MPDASPPSIGEALRRGARLLSNSETAQLDARILLKHVMGADDGDLIANAEKTLGAKEYEHFLAVIARRAASEPIAYITGEKEFWSLPFRVTRDVLIPRDDSGALIEAAIKRRGRDEQLRIADLGTGSGCLLCALLSEFPNACGIGVDRSDEALKIARGNAATLGFGERAEFVSGDWFAPLSDRFDIIIANPPYIPEGDEAGLSRDVAAYEPRAALFAGADGLNAYRTILKCLPDYLDQGGLALMECGSTQVDSLAAMLAGLAPENAIFTLKDLAGRPRGAGFDLRKGEKGD